MTEVEITEDALIVHVLGWDRLWAFKHCIEVPLSHVLDAKVDPKLARGWWKGVKAPGTEVPGVIKAGTFYRGRKREFWDVRNPDNSVVVRLRNENYGRLIIEVKDPLATVTTIRRALNEERE